MVFAIKEANQMKEETKETLKTVAFWTGVGIAYVGLCYVGYKAFGKLIGKEVARYIAKAV